MLRQGQRFREPLRVGRRAQRVRRRAQACCQASRVSSVWPNRAATLWVMRDGRGCATLDIGNSPLWRVVEERAAILSGVRYTLFLCAFRELGR